MANSTYRATAGALAFDAFYRDEFGSVNDASNCFSDANMRMGFHKSRFTNVFSHNGQQSESENFATVAFANQANPNENSKLLLKQHGCPPKGSDNRTMHFYFSNAVLAYWQHVLSANKPWDVPIHLTVFFAVGTEINRHGIRSFFEAQSNMQGIVLVSGVEVPRDNPVRIGVSPSTQVLAQQLKELFGIEVRFSVKVLAAFSTGYCGLNSCIQNELLPLSEVERLVFYDCMYLYGADCNTVNTIEKLKRIVDKTKFKMIAYQCTQGANSFADKEKKVLHPALLATFPDRKGLISNLYYNVYYTYLITARLLDTAFEDQVLAFPNVSFKEAFEKIRILMPKRGYMISNLAAYQYVYGMAKDVRKFTVFDSWVRENQTALRAFGKFLGSTGVSSSIRGLMWQNMLPGWSGGDGEENHDLLIPEFGWEYLPY